jgi:methanogenic corrinoid protein MtbC1
MDPFGQYVSNLISASRREVAEAVVQRQVQLDPSSARQGALPLEHEASLRLDYLAEALAAGRPALFEHHVAWLKAAYSAREIPLRILSDGIHCTGEVLQERLPDAALGLALEFLSAGEQTLWSAPASVPTLLPDGALHVDLARGYLLALLENRARDAVALLRDACRGGVDIRDIHEHVIGAAQAELGRMWQMNELAVAEEHVATRITEQALTLLAAERPEVEPNGHRVVATAITGNQHEVRPAHGVRPLRDGGLRGRAVRRDMPVLEIAAGVRDYGADLVAVSANMMHVRTTAGLIATLRNLPRPRPCRSSSGGTRSTSSRISGRRSARTASGATAVRPSRPGNASSPRGDGGSVRPRPAPEARPRPRARQPARSTLEPGTIARSPSSKRIWHLRPPS